MPERPYVKLTAGVGADIVRDFDKQVPGSENST